MNRRSFFAALSALVVTKPATTEVTNHFNGSGTWTNGPWYALFDHINVEEIHRQIRPTEYVINGRVVSAEEFLHRFH